MGAQEAPEPQEESHIRTLLLEKAGRKSAVLPRRGCRPVRAPAHSHQSVSDRLDKAPCVRVNVSGEPGAQRKVHAGFGRGQPETPQRKLRSAPAAHLTLVYAKLRLRVGWPFQRTLGPTCFVDHGIADLVPRTASFRGRSLGASLASIRGRRTPFDHGSRRLSKTECACREKSGHAAPKSPARSARPRRKPFSLSVCGLYRIS